MLVTQSCLTLCDHMDCCPPGSSVHEILQARILEWVAISFSRGSSQPRNQTWVSCMAGRFFTIWVTREAPSHPLGLAKCLAYLDTEDLTYFEKVMKLSLPENEEICCRTHHRHHVAAQERQRSPRNSRRTLRLSWWKSVWKSSIALVG